MIWLAGLISQARLTQFQYDAILFLSAAFGVDFDYFNQPIKHGITFEFSGAIKFFAHRWLHKSASLGPSYEIGHAYLLDAVAFLQEDLGDRNGSIFLWDSAGNPRVPLKRLWSMSLKPLIAEYLAGIDAQSRTNELERLEKVLVKLPVEVD